MKHSFHTIYVKQNDAPNNTNMEDKLIFINLLVFIYSIIRYTHTRIQIYASIKTRISCTKYCFFTFFHRKNQKTLFLWRTKKEFLKTVKILSKQQKYT